MPRAFPQHPPRGAPLGARICDRLLFGRQAGSHDRLPSRPTSAWDDGGSPHRAGAGGYGRATPAQAKDMHLPGDVLNEFAGVDANSPAHDRAAFTRQLAAAGEARRVVAAAANRTPPMSIREQQERLLREDSGANSTAGARSRAAIAYAKRTSDPSMLV
jgi:hypothetical protein